MKPRVDAGCTPRPSPTRRYRILRSKKTAHRRALRVAKRRAQKQFFYTTLTRFVHRATKARLKRLRAQHLLSSRGATSTPPPLKKRIRHPARKKIARKLSFTPRKSLLISTLASFTATLFPRPAKSQKFLELVAGYRKLKKFYLRYTNQDCLPAKRNRRRYKRDERREAHLRLLFKRGPAQPSASDRETAKVSCSRPHVTSRPKLLRGVTTKKSRKRRVNLKSYHAHAEVSLKAKLHQR